MGQYTESIIEKAARIATLAHKDQMLKEAWDHPLIKEYESLIEKEKSLK
jgi:hypothetical protein